MLTRYSRQMLLLGGLESQTDLSSSSVCVVGAGGIGSTVILYLIGVGIGRLTVIDHDSVEESNLHRQIIHDTTTIGMNKAKSAALRGFALNPSVNIQPISCKLNTCNALELLKGHNVVVDATDNYQSRYIISDACILLQIPLVSGSAIGFEGQITVLCTAKGPCHRCLYPVPNIVESCRSCVNSGVLGPVPGLIGCMQATETIKLLLTSSSTLLSSLVGKQVYYDGMSGECNTYELTAKDPSCASCGNSPSILLMTDTQDFIDKCEQSIRMNKNLVEIPPINTITALEYSSILEAQVEHILLDVRSSAQFSMQRLPVHAKVNLVNFPLRDLTEIKMREILHKKSSGHPLFVVCRRGIDSVRATDLLIRWGFTQAVNINGGMEAWKKEVDSSFEMY